MKSYTVIKVWQSTAIKAVKAKSPEDAVAVAQLSTEDVDDFAPIMTQVFDNSQDLELDDPVFEVDH